MLNIFTNFYMLLFCLHLCMYVCMLLNNIRANPLLFTIAQFTKTSVDSTMIKIRKEKIYIYKTYD
jgi:hypothetical protein